MTLNKNYWVGKEGEITREGSLVSASTSYANQTSLHRGGVMTVGDISRTLYQGT